VKSLVEVQDLRLLLAALEASWDEQTSYQGAVRSGNPAFGQCYPTARLIQQLDPRMEIVRGTVQAADGFHTHFWNALPVGAGPLSHLDLTWHQFDAAARVCASEVLNREKLGDSQTTIERCDLLQARVVHWLSQSSHLNMGNTAVRFVGRYASSEPLLRGQVKA
jgi:hypothetical protein